MTISQKTFELSNPRDDERVPADTFAYLETRNRFHVYNLILNEFARSGISQATLGRRLGKGPDQVSRLLGSPGNLTLDTISNVLFAISGSEPIYDLDYPLEKAARNDLGTEWLETVIGEQTIRSISSPASGAVQATKIILEPSG
jgi:hypothetical protein